MILVHIPRRGSGAPPDALDRQVLKPDEVLPADALWIDLVEPTREEDRLVEAHLGISIPTRQEMADIEPSEILYQEDGARYMTARIICRSDTALPSLTDVSFILTDRALVTVRYDEPKAFAMFASRAVRPGGCRHQPEAVLDGLVETSSTGPPTSWARSARTSTACRAPSSTATARARAAPPPSGPSCAPSGERATWSRTCARAWPRSNACSCSFRPP